MNGGRFILGSVLKKVKGMKQKLNNIANDGVLF